MHWLGVNGRVIHRRPNYGVVSLSLWLSNTKVLFVNNEQQRVNRIENGVGWSAEESTAPAEMARSSIGMRRPMVSREPTTNITYFFNWLTAGKKQKKNAGKRSFSLSMLFFFFTPLKFPFYSIGDGRNRVLSRSTRIIVIGPAPREIVPFPNSGVMATPERTPISFVFYWAFTELSYISTGYSISSAASERLMSAFVRSLCF